MPRALDTATLDAAAEYYAGVFMMNAGERNRDWVMSEFFKFAFKDEFDHLVAAMAGQLGPAALADFEARGKKTFEPRKPKVLEELLANKLAIDFEGKHIDGQIGTTNIGARRVGTTIIEVEAPWSIMRRRMLGLPKTAEHREVIQKVVPLDWPLYAGEGHERARSQGGVADPLPPGFQPLPIGALDTRISNDSAKLGADSLVDALDEGSLGAVIQGRTTPRPADPDTTVTGTNLFTMTCSVTAFTAATDAAPGALKTASTITDDTSADATGTLLYIRASGSSVADTPLAGADHIDGEAATSGGDWNFNTLAIVAAATVSATSWTITLPES